MPLPRFHNRSGKKEKRERIPPAAFKIALNQAQEGPTSGKSTSPSVEGKGMSPFEAAALQGTLPPKIIGGYEKNEGEKRGQEESSQAEHAKKLEFLRQSLEMEAKTPK